MALKSLEFTALLSLFAGMQYFSPAHSAHHCAPELQLELNLCRLGLQVRPPPNVL